MTDEPLRHTVLFPECFHKPVVAQFDQAHSSSDGGAVLLKAADTRLGLTTRLAACLADPRPGGKVIHTLQDLVAQRVFGIACGYPDANDADGLADDPLHKLLLDRDPIDGARLASQPTISRFENGVDGRTHYVAGRELAHGAAVLRPGNAPATRGALGLLRRLVALVRQAFPRARIRVRLDGGFACPESSRISRPSRGWRMSSGWRKTPC